MKKLALLACALLLLASCELPSPLAAQGEEKLDVYFLDGVRFVSESHSVPGDTILKRVNALLDSMRTPIDASLQPLAPEGLSILRVIISFNTATVDFSPQYAQLSELERSSLCAAVSRTMFDFTDIDYVRFSCSSEFLQPISDRYYNPYTVMFDDSMIRFNAWDVLLYFPTEDRTGLAAIEMTVKTEERELSPEQLLAQLMRGSGSYLAPFRGAIRAYTLTMRDDLCTVDLTPSPVSGFPIGQPSDVYAIVNTLCSLGRIERVHLTIAGREPSNYGIPDCDGELRFRQDLLR